MEQLLITCTLFFSIWDDFEQKFPYYINEIILWELLKYFTLNNDIWDNYGQNWVIWEH